ncbi:hypothetical protein GGD55_004914 [Rhizobium giardinii]|uniref:Uncharacterized protein n=1 Tax=Rhizobium giardinii TaxID=56731 RepID=A0A7W8UFC0_9HYPH|nr:hypothetical protein [Rhizobium giardinii]MBB5538193.1 hypothetical protein [Rhizobium giardinii]
MRVYGREKYAIPSHDWKNAGMSGHATVDSRDPPVRLAAGTAIVGVVAKSWLSIHQKLLSRPPVLTAR